MDSRNQAINDELGLMGCSSNHLDKKITLSRGGGDSLISSYTASLTRRMMSLSRGWSSSFRMIKHFFVESRCSVKYTMDTQPQRKVPSKSGVTTSKADDGNAGTPDHSYKLHNHKGRYLVGVGSLRAKLIVTKLERSIVPTGYTTTKLECLMVPASYTTTKEDI
ncbi:unnamed protein product [Citrullus colocynthis]|uniref:Uncharacterized protein n=1 Tax=Citrullus colocynthis TaxID=252529 RepID=A0ABP0YUF4_9ROSI